MSPTRLTASEKYIRQISEHDWQNIVINIARINGWSTYHAPDNRPGRSGHVQQIVAGWPDLAFVRENEFFVAELKREIGKASPEQVEWIRLLDTAGIEAYIWRPSDEREVRERLGRKALRNSQYIM